LLKLTILKESTFIKQNKENWKNYEEVLRGKSDEPDELNDLFIQVTDDLSYARSFYPNRSVRLYLNEMAQKVFFKLYTNRKRKQSFIVKFFSDDLPKIMFTAQKELLICFLVFLFTFGIGVFSSKKDPTFAKQILSESYVEMTNRNIKEGKPMQVYSQGHRLESFFAIARNNLKVDMLTFVTGIIFCIGTLFVLAYNGVMVGVFQYFFYGTGYFTVSVLTIWLHGTLEIFTMILSATAGLVFGKGLIFPGTYSRLQAFRLSAIKGVKIVLVVFIMTLIAAFIEAFITGQSQAPNMIRGGLILLSLLFILFYFVWLPQKKYSETGILVEDDELPFVKLKEVSYTEIKTIGEIVADTFRIWKTYLSFNLSLSLLLSLSVLFLIYFTENGKIEYQFFNEPPFLAFVKILKINAWFRDGYYKVWPWLVLTVASFSVLVLFRFFKRETNLKWTVLQGFSRILLCLIILTSVLYSFYLLDGFWFFIVFFFLLFPLAISLSTAIIEQGILGIGLGFRFYFKSFFAKQLLNISLLILVFIIYLACTSPLFNLIIEAITNSLKISDTLYLKIQKFTILIIGLSTLFTMICLYIYSHVLHYLSIKEKFTATNLRLFMQKLWE